MLLLCCKYRKLVQNLEKASFFIKKNISSKTLGKTYDLLEDPPENFLCYAILEDPGSSITGGGYKMCANKSQLQNKIVFQTIFYYVRHDEK